MFYEDDDKVQVVEFGKGDMLFCGGLSEDMKCGTLSIVDNCGKCHPIGTPHDFDEMTADTDLNTVIRLVFTIPESIDVLVAELHKAQAYMQNPESHPWYDKMKTANQAIPADVSEQAVAVDRATQCLCARYSSGEKIFPKRYCPGCKTPGS